MALRNLLGASHHDPGNDGKDDNEGEAGMTMLCLIYFFALFIFVYDRFIKKKEDKKDFSEELVDAKAFAAANAEADGSKNVYEGMTDDEIRDKIAQDKWTQPAGDHKSPEYRAKFIRTASFGALSIDDKGPVRDFLHYVSGINWLKIFLIVFIVYCVWTFLLVLNIMGTGFKLLGGKSSAKMFDVVDNPISALMVGILATVLVQSSSTTTSIIISLVGANELSVKFAVFMIMGANIGTSVTNTIVAMGHFNNPEELRRGFSAATVHDVFNMIAVAIWLPINWIYPVFKTMTYEMVKDIDACDDSDGEDCQKTEFLKPYVSPYTKGIAAYDKKVADFVSQNYCNGYCDEDFTSTQMAAVSAFACTSTSDCSNFHADWEASWMDGSNLLKTRAPLAMMKDASGKVTSYYECPSGANCASNPFFTNGVGATSMTASTYYNVCSSSKMSTTKCDARLLKGGLAYDTWDMSDKEAGTTLTILSLAALCATLFCIVYVLQIVVKGPAARMLKKAVGLNGYLNMVIGCGITILVQSSSITTSTLTPIAAVGLITLEEMFPLTLGANVGTTVSGIMAATVVTSNPVEAWQVALTHFFFNVFSIMIVYPLPVTRAIPLAASRWLGRMTANETYGKIFPLVYTGVVFMAIPGAAYGIAVAASS